MPEVGDQLGRYTLLSHLASGGMGEIFIGARAGPLGFGPPIVLKTLKEEFCEDESFIEMLVDEANISRFLNHQNVVSVLDFGEDGGMYYIAMEYVQGLTLQGFAEALKKAQRPMEVPLLLFVASELCRALKYAHTRTNHNGEPLNIIHRDVTPGNVLISIQGEVKLTDFGIARAKGRSHQTQAGVLKGKFGYMAPEMLRYEAIDARADLFCTGVVMYELVAGQHPVQGCSIIDAIERFEEKKIDPPSTLNPAIPPELDVILMRCLEPKPDNRWSSADELGNAFQELALRTADARGGVGSQGASRLSAVMREIAPETFANPVDPQLADRLLQQAREAAAAAGVSLDASATSTANGGSAAPGFPSAAPSQPATQAHPVADLPATADDFAPVRAPEVHTQSAQVYSPYRPMSNVGTVDAQPGLHDERARRFEEPALPGGDSTQPHSAISAADRAGGSDLDDKTIASGMALPDFDALRAQAAAAAAQGAQAPRRGFGAPAFPDQTPSIPPRLPTDALSMSRVDSAPSLPAVPQRPDFSVDVPDTLSAAGDDDDEFAGDFDEATAIAPGFFDEVGSLLPPPPGPGRPLGFDDGDAPTFIPDVDPPLELNADATLLDQISADDIAKAKAAALAAAAPPAPSFGSSPPPASRPSYAEQEVGRDLTFTDDDDEATRIRPDSLNMATPLSPDGNAGAPGRAASGTFDGLVDGAIALPGNSFSPEDPSRARKAIEGQSARKLTGPLKITVGQNGIPGLSSEADTPNAPQALPGRGPGHGTFNADRVGAGPHAEDGFAPTAQSTAGITDDEWADDFGGTAESPVPSTPGPQGWNDDDDALRLLATRNTPSSPYSGGAPRTPTSQPGLSVPQASLSSPGLAAPATSSPVTPYPGPGPMAQPLVPPGQAYSAPVQPTAARSKVPLIAGGAVGLVLLVGLALVLLTDVFWPSLTLSSTPPGASVSLDGQPLAVKTPAKVSVKPWVKHNFRFTLAGHHERGVGPFEAGLAEDRSIEVVFERITHVVKISPEGGRVFINDRQVGAGTSVKLPPLDEQETVEIKVEASGFKTFRQSFDSAGALPDEIVVELEKS